MRITINLRLYAEDCKAFALSLGMEKFDDALFRSWAKSLVETAMGDLRADNLGEGQEAKPKEKT